MDTVVGPERPPTAMDALVPPEDGEPYLTVLFGDRIVLVEIGPGRLPPSDVGGEGQEEEEEEPGPSFDHSLVFNDSRNSMYLGQLV